MYRFAHSGPGEAQGIATFNPANPSEQVGLYGLTAAAELPQRLARARAAQRLFAARPAGERLALLARWIGAVEARADDIARAITREQGKPLAEARGETAKAIDEARQMLAIAAQPSGAVHASARDGVLPLSIRRPRGVIAALTPWNFPVLTPMRKLAPALAFGNAIILKPSELAPAAACLLFECSEGIVPDGLFQIVIGGAELGAALVRSGAEGVTFTGSVATGKAVYRTAAETLAEISLELGGKNAAVIHDATDLARCLDQVSAAAFLCSGQRCTAISRVIVRQDLAEAVTAGLVQRAEALVAGDGLQQGVNFGPLISATHRDQVARMVAQGLDAGARCRTGGHAPDMPGHFYAPTILDQVDPANPIARDEVFGPVLSVLTYETLDQAFDILDDTEFGLTSALYSTDSGVIARFMAESRTGMVHVNHATTPDSNMPFVGIRNSGVGACSVGPGAAAFYTTEHAVYLGQQ